MSSNPPGDIEAERDEAELSRDELSGRLIYSVLNPAVRLARVFGVGVKDLGNWLELNYFHDLRKEGMTLQEAADVLQVSMRKASQLSNQLKQNFFAPERERELSRRIEFMVWAEPMSQARIEQALAGADAEEIEQALEQLLEEGRIVEQSGRTTTYAVARAANRIMPDDWMRRIDALNKLLETMVNAVYARFLDKEAKAGAKNLEFRVRPEDIEEVNRVYEEHVWPRLKALDEAAIGDATAVPMELSMCWAPAEYLQSRIQAPSNDGDES